MIHMTIDASQSRWTVAARCNDAPSYIFFPEEKNDPKFRPDPLFDGMSFRDFCDDCPVMHMCKEFAVLHDAYGIWGGSTDNQRNRRYKKEERWEMRDLKEDEGTYSPLYGHS